jgi:hypothetical protein
MFTLSNATPARQATVPASPILTHVNGRPVSYRGLQNRLRLLRDYIRATATATLRLHQPLMVASDGWLLLRGLPLDCLECQAYRDLAAIYGEIRTTQFLSRLVDHELMSRAA